MNFLCWWNADFSHLSLLGLEGGMDGDTTKLLHWECVAYVVFSDVISIRRKMALSLQHRAVEILCEQK